MAAMEKNNKTLNVPHLRFPEFSGEWEKYSLGSCFVQVENGVTYDPSNTVGLPVTRIETISDKTINYDKVGYEKESERMSRYQMFSGDILFSHINSLKHIGKTAYYMGERPLYHGMNLLLLRTSATFDSKYLYYQLNTQWFLHRCQVIANQAVNQASINTKELKKIILHLPSIDEQQRISKLLSLVDQRIETQKKIIKDLKKLKDAICNVNFTSGSALKLGNVGKFVRGLTYSASDVIDDTMGTAVMRSNNISNGDPVNFEELVWVNKIPNHEQILRDGDILICMANGSSPLVGKASYYVDCGMYSATVGAFCGIYRSYNPLTKWLFQSKHYKKHIQRCIQGGNGAIANIYPEDILAISFNIPSGYERVLNVLNSLEKKYLLEQKLLYRYLAIKSHLLAQLFI